MNYKKYWEINMKNYIENEIILKKIKDNTPIINIDVGDLDKYDEKSLRLFFPNNVGLSLENFLSRVREEINELDFRNIKEVIIIFFISKDFGERVKAHDFQNLISEIPKGVDICYGIYIIAENNNKLQIIFTGKYNKL